MKTAVYLRSENRVVGWVTMPQGTLPDGCEFLSEEQVPTDARFDPPPIVPPVPRSVSRRQFRGALRRKGLFEAVENLRHSPHIDEVTRGDLNDFLDAATIIERDHRMISTFAPILNVTEEEIDDVFRLAATL